MIRCVPDPSPQKVYVRVTAEFCEDGRLIPLSFVWEDGTKYMIDRVLDITHAASLKAGGVGLRYACMVRGHQTYLFHEEDRWFIERKG